ncbi:MAG: hypothetical protein HUU20_25220 [Pirellulales bacterium]|nr:hypothetical protein [Pirellulales bacterium]
MLRRTAALVSSFAALSLVFLASAFAEPSRLRVATFRCDVTPPLGGHPLIWLDQIKTVEDPLWAKGIVLDDGRSRYVLCAVDWCGLCNSSHELFRVKIAKAAGAEIDNVAVQSIHQHTAPYTDGDAQRVLDKYDNPPKYVDFQFMEAVTDRLAEAVKKSLSVLEPFDTVGVGQAKVEKVAATRRVLTPDGKILVRYSSCKDPGLAAAPEGKIDPFLRTVTFAQGDKPLVRLHYYTTHPQSFYGDFRASADFVGHARDRLEKEEGVFQIYFTGCSGDVTAGKYNDGSPEARERLTQQVFAGMKQSVDATKYEPAGKLVWRCVPLVLPARTDGDRSKEASLAVVQDAKAAPQARTLAACRVAYAQRDDKPLPLSSLQIGDNYLVNLPGECMVEYQLYAAGQRPKDFVAVAAYGDLGPGYICTEAAFPEGGYEPTASRVAPTSEKPMKDAIRRLLGLE